MSFITESTSAQIPAGDRSFVTAEKKKRQPADIPGYEQELDEQGQPIDSYVSEDSTGTRTDALRSLAKSEGIQNLDDSALEDLLAQVMARKKKKAPEYDGKVDRVGV